MSSIKRSRCVKHLPGQDTRRCSLTCENFLYVFKAAPRGRTRRRHGGRPALPLELPCRTAPTPVGWREDHNHEGPPWHTAVSTVQESTTGPGFGSYREQVCSRTWHCPARPEPVKGAYGVGYAADP